MRGKDFNLPDIPRESTVMIKTQKQFESLIIIEHEKQYG